MNLFKNFFSGNYNLIIVSIILFIKTLLFLNFSESYAGHDSVLIYLFYFLVYYSFILIMLSFSFLFKRRGHLIYLISFDLIFSLLTIADLWYYRGFSGFLSLYTARQTANLENLSDSIFSMYRIKDLLFIVDIIPLCILSFFPKKMNRKYKKSLFKFILTLVLPIFFIYTGNFLLEKSRGLSLLRTTWKPNETIGRLSPIGYHLNDVWEFFTSGSKIDLDEKEISEIKNWFRNNIENSTDSNCSQTFKGYNLLVIQVESLESFVINNNINGQEVTPVLNKLLKNSFYFTNFYEQINNGGSSDADLMTNTSIYPTLKGSAFVVYSDNKYFSLPLFLKDSGYYTVAVKSDKGVYFNWKPALKSIGFGNCMDYSYFSKDDMIRMGLSDSSYFAQTLKLVKGWKKPFYSFLVTVTSHAPFLMPKDRQYLKLPDELNKTKIGQYFQAINYVDRHIGLFLDKLDKSCILDSTIVVIYGDHTSLHKYYADELEEMKHKESWWLTMNQKIPLIIFSKGQQQQTIPTIGGQIDVMPTLLFLLGMDKSLWERTAMGKNLLKTKRNYTYLPNKGIIGKQEENKKAELSNPFVISDKIIRSDYFRNYYRIVKK